MYGFFFFLPDLIMIDKFSFQFQLSLNLILINFGIFELQCPFCLYELLQ